MLTEVKNDRQHYFKDELGRRQGEYKSWYENGQLKDHDFFVDNYLHGECKRWWDNGHLQLHGFYNTFDQAGEFKSWHEDGHIEEHSFYSNSGKYNVNVTQEVTAIVKDVLNITDEERVLIKLQWGIECLP